MVVYLARHVVYLNRIVVTGMGNIGMSNIGMSNIGMSNIGMSTGAYGNVKSPDFPLHQNWLSIEFCRRRDVNADTMIEID